jgi:hypothetical protein
VNAWNSFNKNIMNPILLAQIAMESPEYLKLIFPAAAKRPEEAPAAELEK